ncbi:cutinase family protein [Microbacterium enclense]|uniref:cutinase family protein n=1 Tax=Microbacterium enclense TaxID=993073 RepID=UPI0021A688A1|nr:cutinase family protein [Microbacterium enclense]MCT2085554.1 cutinase family protein [Microbacterium enclense]
MRARPHGQRHYRTEHFTRAFRAATAAVLVGVLSVSGISPASAATPSPTSSPTVANAAFASAPTPTFTGSMGTGSKLTASTGTWTPTPDAFTYQWRRNGIAIAGATAKSFTLTPDEFGKAITVTVTATKSGYVKTAKTSAGKTAVAGAFTSAPSPTIGGNLAIGSTLTARVSTWSPTPSALSYQWKRDGSAIPGATASTYRLAAGDGGAAIAVTVTAATRGYISTTRTSAPASIPASSFTTAPTPTFSGSLSVGSTLTASAGTWAPVPGALTFAWSRNGKAIPGATAKTYVLVPDDNGAKIAVSVTATKAGHTTTTKTSAARTATPGPFITAPVPNIVGTGAIGATVTAAPGAWAPVPALLEYQWNRSGTAIAGATASTYRIGTADAGTLLTVTVTASAPGYVTTTRVSTGKGVPTRRFTTTPMPTFSGTARVGSTLTASPGAWSPAPDSLTYQWNRGGAAISGATGSTYTVAAADVGRAITVTVTAVKAGYTRTSTTSTAATATAATFSTAPTPTVTGLARVGGTLFGVAGAWDPQPSALTYQWTRNGIAIAGATSATYLVTTADRGAQLRFTVTAARAGYTGLTRVSAAQAVPGVYSSSPTPRISGALEPGSTVSAVVGSWTPKPDSFRFQWRRNGNPIAGATSKSYTLTQADAEAKLSVTVTAVKANYSSTSKTSAPSRVASTAIVRVTSDIAADTTWAPSVPTVYLLERDVQVAPGATLTIAAGTVVKFGQQASLLVEGSLIAKGTTTAPVTFTSLFDDTAGGDTLADGDDTTPTPGSWAGITVSGRKASLTLDRVRIGFAQYGVGSGETLSTSVTSSTIDGGISASQIGGAVTVTGNTVRDGSITIDRPDGSAYAFGVTVTGNTIQRGNLTVRSENYSAAAPPIKVTGNTITGFDPGYSTWNRYEFPLQIRDVKLRPSNLTGNTVTGNTANVFKVSGILIENWTLPTTGPTILIDDDTSGYDDFTITTGATLTAPAGTVVKFGQQASLLVEGSLIAKGTTTAPVTFTSLFDDTAGGDTLADGDDTTPTPGSWAGITVSGRKASLTLDRVRIGFAQYGVGSGETLSTSVTSSTIDGGISASQIGGAVTVTGNTVRDGSITIDRPDGSAYAFGVTVTGNTIQRGNLTVRSENYSAAAPPIKVTGNTITGFDPGYSTWNRYEFPLQIRDVKLRPSNLTGNTVTGNTANVFKVSGILIENWTLPTTGPTILIDDDTSGYDDFTITTGATLTAPAGTVVKFGQQASLLVEGSLIAKGTTTAPVTFTSLFDDTAGGDTLADGDDTTPTPGSWTGISLARGSFGGTNVAIRYAASGVVAVDISSLALSDSTIQKTSDTCINVVGADATSYFHGVLRDCPVGVSGGLTPFDATNVDWGSNRSPGNGFDARPRAQGPGVQVLPWVGWVEPPAATRPASPAPNTTSCADFLFVGVRGSGEPGSSATGGMGAMVWSVYQQLKRKMRAEDPNVSFRTIGLDYPAYAVPMSAPNAPDLFTYNQGAWQGALELMSVLKDETDRCAGSGEKIVLGGYSQGSWVIHATLSYASRSQKLELSTIVSVGLVADPQRQAYAPELNVGTASESSWGIANAQVVGRPAARFSGWLAGSIYPEVKKFAAENPTSDDMLRVEDIPAAMLAKTVTICDSHDPVCAIGADNDIDVHSGYANHLDTFTSELTWTTRAFGG